MISFEDFKKNYHDKIDREGTQHTMDAGVNSGIGHTAIRPAERLTDEQLREQYDSMVSAKDTGLYQQTARVDHIAAPMTLQDVGQ